MGNPISRRMTPNEARIFVDALDPAAFKQLAGLVGGGIFLHPPDENTPALELTLELVTATFVILANTSFPTMTVVAARAYFDNLDPTIVQTTFIYVGGALVVHQPDMLTDEQIVERITAVLALVLNDTARVVGIVADLDLSFYFGANA